MIALYLGMILVEVYYLFSLTSRLHEQFGSEMAYENLDFLIIVTLIGAVPAVVAYAVGRHFSGQQTKPWWVFFLLGGLLIFVATEVSSAVLQTQWGADNLLRLMFLLPLLLSFLLAWLPLERVTGPRRQRPFDCPHCGHSAKGASKSVNKADKKALVCAHCQGHMKRVVDTKRLAMWFVPVLILVGGMWLNLIFLTPLAPWLVFFAVLLYLLSLRMQPHTVVASSHDPDKD